MSESNADIITLIIHLNFRLQKKNKFTVRKQDSLMVDLRLSQRCS